MPTTDPAGMAGLRAVLLLVVVVLVPLAVAAGPLLRSLPEPAADDAADDKVVYRALATPRFVGACVGVAAVAALTVGLTLPTPAWPLWWVLAGPALLLVAVDARTTWMPWRLTRLTWATAAGAAVLVSLLGGPAVVVRVLVGAAAAGLLYLLLWRLSGRKIGFGDVQLAPVLGAAAAAVDWSAIFMTLLLGSLLGAMVGVVLALRGRPGAFAYAPSMLGGAFLACAVRALSG